MRSAVVQTVTIRPARSNVTEAHSPPRSPRAVEITSGSRPSGPLSGWVSLAGPSACMLFQPFRAMNGCCATAGDIERLRLRGTTREDRNAPRAEALRDGRGIAAATQAAPIQRQRDASDGRPQPVPSPSFRAAL